MSLLLETALRTTVVIGLALGLATLLRNRSAAVRHWVLATGIICAATVPVLTWIAPAWSIGARAGSALIPVESIPAAMPENLPGVSAMSSATPDADTSAPTLVDLATGSWIAGVVVNLGVLLIGVWQLQRIARRAHRVTSGCWQELADEICGQHARRPPIRLLQSDHASLLVTWGLFTPKVLLPIGANGWSHDRIRIVLRHELAHIERRDWIVQIAAELLRSLHWFNPLVWIVCSRLRQQSERACDDEVVNAGVPASEYATHLLDLARSLGRSRRTWLPAPAIIPRQSGLEGRISAMLNTHLNHRPMTRLARVATVLAVLGLTLPIAGFAQDTFATFSGTIVDQLDAALPAVKVVVIDSERDARHEVRTDRAGRFTLVGLPRGSYAVETELLGFRPFRGQLTIDGQDVHRDITLQVGSLEETITVVNGTPERVFPSYRSARLSVPPCKAPTSTDRIGGNIRQPRKLHHVSPQYPNSNVEGVVTLQTVIGTDGLVKDVNMVSSPDVALTRAAVDAVRQWEFDQTLLNCVPIEVDMHVTVSFKRQ